MSNPDMSLADKVDLLFEHGRKQGKNVTYQAIGEATGVAWTNLMKIRNGKNANPGLRVVQALAAYFEVKLDYFDCQTPEECQNYLDGVSEESIARELVKLRGHNLSPKALMTLEAMIEYVKQAEHMTSGDQDASEGSRMGPESSAR